MIVHTRKFLRRPAADRRLLVQALVLHAWVAALLRLVRFGRLNRWLGTNNVRTVRRFGLHDISAENVKVERVVWAVHQVSAVMPWGRTCLTEALTMSVMLRRIGCETTLQYGVSADNRRGFAAHAWLEQNGAAVGDSTSRTYMALRHARRAA